MLFPFGRQTLAERAFFILTCFLSAVFHSLIFTFKWLLILLSPSFEDKVCRIQHFNKMDVGTDKAAFPSILKYTH